METYQATRAPFQLSSTGKKHQVNALLTDVGRDCLYTLQSHYGLSQAGIIEMLLRDKVRELGYDLSKLKKLGQGPR